jgi:hypothetical protein
LAGLLKMGLPAIVQPPIDPASAGARGGCSQRWAELVI